MLIGERIAAALPELRAHAESRMKDLCRVERKGEPVRDPANGTYSDTWTLVYEGKCRVQNDSNLIRTTMTGERERSVDDTSLHVPMSVTGIEVGDRATITAAVNDPDLVNRVLWVSGHFHKADATARRLPVSEIQQ